MGRLLGSKDKLKRAKKGEIRIRIRPKKQIKSLLERFNEKYIFDKKTGCWEWTACKNDSGYGSLNCKIFGKKFVIASRVSYTLFIGEIPEKMEVCHFCDNPGCVSPFHFFLGTHTENIHDAIRKGRLPTSVCPSRQMYKKGCRCDLCRKLWAEIDLSNKNKNIEEWKRRRADYARKYRDRIKLLKQNT